MSKDAKPSSAGHFSNGHVGKGHVGARRLGIGRIGIGRLAWECFLDLGITVVYATIAGLLIVGVVASDDGPGSIVTSALYASLLPASVTLLITLDIALRALADYRLHRKRAARAATPFRLSRS